MVVMLFTPLTMTSLPILSIIAKGAPNMRENVSILCIISTPLPGQANHQHRQTCVLMGGRLVEAVKTERVLIKSFINQLVNNQEQKVGCILAAT